MLHQSSQLALPAIDTRPHCPDGHERTGGVAGPGWFDSSWDLHRGLEVREGWSDEERVHGWIEDFLRTQRAVGHAVSPGASAVLA